LKSFPVETGVDVIYLNVGNKFVEASLRKLISPAPVFASKYLIGLSFKRSALDYIREFEPDAWFVAIAQTARKSVC